MKVLVDTSVWSLALRRPSGAIATTRAHVQHVDELRRLIANFQVAIIGPIRQELLSGISEPARFKRLRSELTPFADMPLESEHFELAASIYNRCRAKGLQGSNTDFLICAVSISKDLPIFTTDLDFIRFATVLPISLHAAAVH